MKAVIFDLDGVIVSTDEYHYQAWKALADEEVIPFDRTINERLRGVSRLESLDILLEKAAKSYSPKEKRLMADRKNSTYRELLQNLSRKDVLPGVLKTLNHLKNIGIPMAIGSSSRNAPAILEKIELVDEFQVIVSGNDLKASKPDPEVFLLAANKLGMLPEDCLVVEDAEAGVTAALNAGMQVLAVGSAASDPRADFRSTGLEDFREIEKWL